MDNRLFDQLESLKDKSPAIQAESLYRNAPIDFYSLGTAVAVDQAPKAFRPLVVLCSVIGRAVREGYTVREQGEEVEVIIDGHEEWKDNPTDFWHVSELIRELLGGRVRTVGGADIKGTKVSPQEIAFKFGDIELRDKLAARVEAHKTRAPRKLRLAEADVKSLENSPPYVLFELMHCALDVVQAPTAVYEGLRSELPGGRAYVGRPVYSFDNNGNKLPPPEGKIFAVFTDADDYVFDWGWFDHDADDPNTVVDAASRFTKRIESNGEAFISGLDQLPKAHFVPRKWIASARGDCAFWYVSDAPSYGIRLGPQVTEYRSLAGDQTETVGYKYKGIPELLDQLSKEQDMEERLKQLAKQHEPA